MPKQTLVSINGSAGAYVNIVASQPVRRLEIVEDDAAAATGLTYQLPRDAFATTFNVAPTSEPIVVGNKIAEGNAFGQSIGFPQRTDPGGRTIAGTIMAKVRSRTAGTTSVRVTEYE